MPKQDPVGTPETRAVKVAPKPAITREEFINRYHPLDQMMLKPFERDLDALLAAQQERYASVYDAMGEIADTPEKSALYHQFADKIRGLT